MENKSCSSAKARVYLTAEQREILWVDSPTAHNIRHYRYRPQ